MSHIFISYARKDIEFAGRIVQALARHKLDSWIDWKSIPKGEDWEQEIYRGIERADAFLFLVSLSSVRSEMCNKEIVHAVEHGKRIIPIFIGDADVGDVNGKFHTSRAREEITKRNYVFCRDGVDDFDRAIEDTRNTIHTDYEWLKYHTDLLKKALEWDRNKDKSRLLTGRVLADAELRISRVEKEMKDPFPSLIQYQFIHASRAEEERARQSRNKIRNIITITFAALAAIAIMLAIGQYEQRQVALANALAARSQAELDQYPQRSLLLAAEALNISQVSAANEALLQAMTHVSGEGLDVRQGYITAVALSRDGQRAAVSASDGQIHLFDLSASDRSAVVLNGSEGVFLLLMFSPDGNRLAASGADTRILLWDFKAGGFSSSPVSITASSPVSNLFFDPNGAWLLVGNSSGAPERIKLGQSSAPLENLDGKGSDVSNLVMSSDGRWLAGSDPNGGILLWDLSTANPSVEKLGDASFTGTALAFSPDCHNLGAGGRNGIIKVWDLDRVAQPEVSLEGSLGPITQLVFSQDGRLLISGHDSTAQVWDLTRNLNSQILSAHEADITQLFITPDDHWLITTSMDGTLRRWDLLSDRPQDSSRAIYGHDSSILSAAMSADGRRLVTGSDDNTARLWDLFSLWDEDAFLVVLPGHTGDITSLAISSDSRLLATGSADQTIRLWDLTHPDSAQLPQILRLHEGDVKELDISPDGKWLISNGGNVMRLWDLTNEPPIPALIESHDGKVVDILLSPDSKWAFSASTPYTADGVFTRWELGATDIAASRASKWGTIGMASGLAISSDGRWLAIGCGFYAPLNSTSVIPCSSQLVDLKEGQKEIRLPSEEGISTRTSTDTYTRVAFSPDVHWLVSTSDSIAVVFNMTAQKIEESGFVLSAGGESLVDHYYPGSASIVDVRFSADGSWLAVQNKSNVISLWKTESLQADPVLFQTVGQVRALTFTADHLKLVAGDDQGSVYTWNLEDVNAEPSIFQDHSAAITTLAASPDGRWLVTGSEDQSVRLRAVKYLNAGSVKDIVCAKAGRNLSQMEWQQYFGDSGLQPVCSRWPLYQTLVNTTKETWRWKYLPVIAGFLKSGVIYCLGSILSLLVGWAIYELYEKAARWWRSW